jgi:hypothetical protein
LCDPQEEEEDFNIPISNAEEDTVVEGTPKWRGLGRFCKRVPSITPVVAVRKNIVAG